MGTPPAIPWVAMADTPPARQLYQSTPAFARDSEELAETLFKGFTADIVELRVHEPPFVAEPAERPLASGWSRLQGAAGNHVTNQHHEVVPLDDLAGHLLGLLDGTRDRPALLDACLGRVAEQGLVVQQHGQPITDAARLRLALAEELKVNLRGLGRSSLLVG
jgi:hypothetical protein